MNPRSAGNLHPVPPSQQSDSVRHDLESLAKQLKETEDLFGQLDERLGYVKTSAPSYAQGGSELVQQFGSPLSNDIRALAERVGRINEQLTETLGCLAI